VAVIVIPLLYEADIVINHDEAWVVYCTPLQQKERLMRREGIQPDKAIRKIESQISIEKKKTMAQVVIDNTRTPEKTRKEVQKAWKNLLSRLENT
ncbi:MAG: dephospho-CoA kinase, partial [Vulcanimicrobiota bacterium]